MIGHKCTLATSAVTEWLIPGRGTQLSFWYRCAARWAANGGLKERVGTKNRDLTDFLEKKTGLKELNFDQICGFGTEILRKFRL